MVKKPVSNEKLLKEIKKLQEQLEQNKAIVPFIPYQPPVIVYPNHMHCTCQWCHPPAFPSPFSPYIISSGGTTNLGIASGAIYNG
jgi:hypothetical protein